MARFFLILSAFIAQSAFSLPSTQRDSEIKKILKKGELRVAIMSDDRWPFFYKEGEELKGIDVEIATRFAESLGVKAKITRNTPGFKSTLETVANDEMDLAISAFYPTVERALNLSFSQPYCKLKASFISLRTHTQNKKQKQRIGTFSNTLFATALQERFPNAEIKAYDKREELWTALEKGLIDSLYADDLEILDRKNRNKNYGLYFKSRVDNESSFPVAIALNIENEHLKELLNLWISNEESTGSLKRICAKGIK